MYDSDYNPYLLEANNSPMLSRTNSEHIKIVNNFVDNYL